MIENVSTIEYASLLYDFYGALLDENKKEVMSLYHEDNLSLKEIAEELGQTRQGVHYTLKKAEATLEKYEEKLGLVQKYLRNLRRYEQVEEIEARYAGEDGRDVLENATKEDIRRDMDILIRTIKDLME
jgi:uncharacterized protein